MQFLRNLDLHACERICLLGDVFDFWLADHALLVRRYQKVVSALEDLKRAGWQILFFEGNHDLHLQSFWSRRLGIDVFTEAQYFTFEGYEFRLEHGDLINLNDLAYLRYRRFVRRPLLRFLANHLPGFFWQAVGDFMSRKSRERGRGRAIDSEALRAMIRQHAARAYRESPFDFIITGHMHVDDDFTFSAQGKTPRSINLGSWLNHPHVTIFEDGQFTRLEISL